jgi:exopolysaccharide production negative regulator
MFARKVTLAAIVLALGFIAPARAADNDGGWASDFYSYLPAAPEIKAPDFDFIPFWTDDLKKAKKAYKSGDFAKARQYFESASEDGNIVADWYLGHLYRLGRGVQQDDAKAFSYYGRVADTFDSNESDPNRLRIMIDALVRVGDYYRMGSKAAGIGRDFDRAGRIYRLAATYGHPAAQYALGVMAIRGQGRKAQPAQGLRWLLTAARKRYAPAEAMLGDIYWKGDLVERDRIRAVMWYILAQKSTDPGESPAIYDRYEEMLNEVSEGERLEAVARARLWTERYPIDNEGGVVPSE